MWEFIKMWFFRIIFLRGIISLIGMLILWIDTKVDIALQSDLEEIEKKKLDDQKKWLEIRLKCMEDYTTRLSENYYKLLMRYYDIMDSKICWKTVEQRLREDKKVSRKSKK